MNAKVKRVLGLFRVKAEERIQALVALVVIVALNSLFIRRLHELFMQPGFGPYWKVFERELHLAGYDPYTYLTVTDWDVIYEVYRHPLLAFLVWPFHQLNEGLTWLTGVNCVQYVVALPLIFCSLYSYLFLYRIHREVVGLGQWDATLLMAFGFSMAYILLSVIVPDHFTISMFLILMTLYISGRCMQKGREFRWWQSAILCFITAGVTLTNGVKVFLAGLFVNLKPHFSPLTTHLSPLIKYLLLAIVLPMALLWGVAMWEFNTFTMPKEKARTEQKIRKAEQEKAFVAQMSTEERARYEAKKAKREKVLQRQAAKTGKPMEDQGFLKWTDISTSRWQTTYDNLFGEALQFHQDYLLEDVLVHRPVFVPYRWKVSYVVEALIVLLVVAGIWCGRKSRFLWLCLSCFAFDMLIHLILGFGINEVFIMTPHWAYMLPVAVAFLFQGVRSRWLRGGVLLLTLYLLIYNGYLLTDFLLSPINSIL